MAIIEVVIGVALLFFLLSTICSTLNEWIAWAVSLRAQTLEKGLRELLQDPEKLEALLNHPLIAPLTKKNKLLSAMHYRQTPVMPSYLPARTFALAFVDTFLRTEGDATPTLDAVRAKVKTLPEVLRAPLLAQLDAAEGEIGKFRKSVEAWYDSTMERVSGWYKRRVQLVILMIATAVTVGLNADSYHVARMLWIEPVMRTALAETTAQSFRECEGQPIADCEAYRTAEQQTAALRDLPIGWSNVAFPDDAVGWLARVFGWLATIIAISLGAPFWFDVLGKLANLRAAGKKPKSSKPG